MFDRTIPDVAAPDPRLESAERMIRTARILIGANIAITALNLAIIAARLMP
jgi:hypothetical protein